MFLVNIPLTCLVLPSEREMPQAAFPFPIVISFEEAGPPLWALFPSLLCFENEYDRLLLKCARTVWCEEEVLPVSGLQVESF